MVPSSHVSVSATPRHSVVQATKQLYRQPAGSATVIVTQALMHPSTSVLSPIPWTWYCAWRVVLTCALPAPGPHHTPPLGDLHTPLSPPLTTPLLHCTAMCRALLRCPLPPHHHQVYVPNMRSQALVTMLRTSTPVRVEGAPSGKATRLDLARYTQLLRFDSTEQAAEFVLLHKVGLVLGALTGWVMMMLSSSLFLAADAR